MRASLLLLNHLAENSAPAKSCGQALLRNCLDSKHYSHPSPLPFLRGLLIPHTKPIIGSVATVYISPPNQLIQLKVGSGLVMFENSIDAFQGRPPGVEADKRAAASAADDRSRPAGVLYGNSIEGDFP
jgi:hypothetical protein